jgi:hypothetical protein
MGIGKTLSICHLLTEKFTRNSGFMNKRLALIDNATLTAVQRLLGHIRVQNLYNIDGDIAAFEGFIQAILFFDGVTCLDDYKAEFRTARQRQFDFIEFIPTDKIEYANLLQKAKELTSNVILRIRGSKIVDTDFSSFFDTLRSHLVFNWRQNTSVFYLTVSLLGDSSGISIEKYGKLHAMISTQLWGDKPDTKHSDGFVLQDSQGNLLPDQFVREEKFTVDTQLKTFVAALNWLSLKTAFYCLVAETTGMNVVLHPIRHAFLLNQLNRINGLPASTYNALMILLKDGITGTIREITHASDPVLSELPLPMFSAYLATRTSNPADFITEALHLKEEGLFVEARRQLFELEQMQAGENLSKYVTEINKLQKVLSETSHRLLSKYGVCSRQDLPITAIANIALKTKTGLSLPRSIDTPVPRSLIGITDSYGFRGLFRSIVNDLVSIERLGALHEIITANVKRDDGARESRVQEESAKWVGRDTWFKKWL